MSSKVGPSEYQLKRQRLVSMALSKNAGQPNISPPVTESLAQVTETPQRSPTVIIKEPTPVNPVNNITIAAPIIAAPVTMPVVEKPVTKPVVEIPKERPTNELPVVNSVKEYSRTSSTLTKKTAL